MQYRSVWLREYSTTQKHCFTEDETTYQSVTRALLAAGRFRAAAQVLEASKTPLGKVPGFR